MITTKVFVYIYVILNIIFCACGDQPRRFNSATDATFMLYLVQDGTKFYCSVNQTTMLEEQMAQIAIITKHHINYVLFGNSELSSKEMIYNNKPYKKFQVNLEGKLSGRKMYNLYIQKNVKNYPPIKYYRGSWYTVVSCDISIHVRLKKIPLSVAINQVELIFERTDLSVADYDGVIYYKFKDGEQADISCGKPDEFGSLTLQYGEQVITASNFRKDHLNTTDYTIRHQIQLRREHSGSYVSCHIQQSNGNDYATVRAYFQLDDESENDYPHNDWMPVAVGSGLCILLMVLFLIIYSIHERQTNTRKKGFPEILYENLPQNSDNTIPNPSQWNEQYNAHTDVRENPNVNSVPSNQNNIADMYAQPQPKRLRKKSKTKEPANYVNLEQTYSEVDKTNVSGCNDPKYAQVLPKNLRNTIREDDIVNYANIAESPNYAKVLPKSQRKLDDKANKETLPRQGYPKIAPKPGQSNADNNQTNKENELNYAEIVHDVSKNNKYENIIRNNEPYANVIINLDYAEPAYCELNIKPK